MIFADTSIWIDYLRHRNPQMQNLLAQGKIVMHPFIVAEISLGSLHNRQERLREMEKLFSVRVAHLAEVRKMIEEHALYSRGIGLIDAHLLASCLLTPGVLLWTRDIPLQKAAQVLNIPLISPII